MIAPMNDPTTNSAISNTMMRRMKSKRWLGVFGISIRNHRHFLLGGLPPLPGGSYLIRINDVEPFYHQGCAEAGDTIAYAYHDVMVHGDTLDYTLKRWKLKAVHPKINLFVSRVIAADRAVGQEVGALECLQDILSLLARSRAAVLYGVLVVDLANEAHVDNTRPLAVVTLGVRPVVLLYIDLGRLGSVMRWPRYDALARKPSARGIKDLLSTMESEGVPGGSELLHLLYGLLADPLDLLPARYEASARYTNPASSGCRQRRRPDRYPVVLGILHQLEAA